MKATKGTILAAVFLGLSCLTSTSLAGPSDTSCSINLPAGTIIRVYPDERLVAGTTSGPLLFTTAADVRFFLNSPPILPRGSKILGRMETSGKGGTLVGTGSSAGCIHFHPYARLLRVSNRCDIDRHQEVSGARGSDCRARSSAPRCHRPAFPSNNALPVNSPAGARTEVNDSGGRAACHQAHAIGVLGTIPIG